MRLKSVLTDYAKKLPSELKKRYGGSGKFGYTKDQVIKTIKDLNLSDEYAHYAIYAYCGKEILKEEIDSEEVLKIAEKLEKILESGDDFDSFFTVLLEGAGRDIGGGGY